MMRESVVLTQFVLDWLHRTRLPRVLHVFERACNLVNERDEIISLVWPSLGAGPFALVLAGERPFVAVRTETNVTIMDGSLMLGDLNINYRNGIVWQPRVDWALGQQKKAALLKILSRLQQILVDERLIETAVFQTKLAEGKKELLCGIQNNQLEQIENGAKKLAGLGQGLTPTGDDFLVGAMIALWVLGSDVALIDAIVSTAVPRTTLLSRAWLQAAGRGELIALWHDFFAGLEDGSWETAVHNILKVGHSSGYDALRGFTAVLQVRMYLLNN